MRKRASINNRELYNFHSNMVRKGERVAKLFFPMFKILGVDPGYLFVRIEGNGSFDLPEDVVDHLDQMISKL